jgi:multicomponent Na+:H+ antiporter subunit B
VSSSILQTATRFLMPLLLLLAIFLLLRGHNDPGGGFVAGLVVSAAFVLYSIAYGATACRSALLLDPYPLLSAGLLIALGSGLPAVVGGRAFMSARWAEFDIGPMHIVVGTPLVFDIGVCLAVIGVVLTIVLTLADVSASED